MLNNLLRYGSRRMVGLQSQFRPVFSAKFHTTLTPINRKLNTIEQQQLKLSLNDIKPSTKRHKINNNNIEHTLPENRPEYNHLTTTQRRLVPLVRAIFNTMKQSRSTCISLIGITGSLSVALHGQFILQNIALKNSSDETALSNQKFINTANVLNTRFKTHINDHLPTTTDLFYSAFRKVYLPLKQLQLKRLDLTEALTLVPTPQQQRHHRDENYYLNIPTCTLTGHFETDANIVRNYCIGNIHRIEAIIDELEMLSASISTIYPQGFTNMVDLNRSVNRQREVTHILTEIITENPQHVVNQLINQNTTSSYYAPSQIDKPDTIFRSPKIAPKNMFSSLLPLHLNKHNVDDNRKRKLENLYRRASFSKYHHNPTLDMNITNYLYNIYSHHIMTPDTIHLANPTITDQNIYKQLTLEFGFNIKHHKMINNNHMVTNHTIDSVSLSMYEKQECDETAELLSSMPYMDRKTFNDKPFTIENISNALEIPPIVREILHPLVNQALQLQQLRELQHTSHQQHSTNIIPTPETFSIEQQFHVQEQLQHTIHFLKQSVIHQWTLHLKNVNDSIALQKLQQSHRLIPKNAFVNEFAQDYQSSILAHLTYNIALCEQAGILITQYKSFLSPLYLLSDYELYHSIAKPHYLQLSGHESTVENMDRLMVNCTLNQDDKKHVSIHQLSYKYLSPIHIAELDRIRTENNYWNVPFYNASLVSQTHDNTIIPKTNVAEIYAKATFYARKQCDLYKCILKNQRDGNIVNIEKEIKKNEIPQVKMLFDV